MSRYRGIPRARRRWLAAVLLSATTLTLAACTDTPPDPDGRGNIRMVHGISDLQAVTFLIEERALATPNFQTTTAYSTFDSLNYDFNFDVTNAASGDVVRVASSNLTVGVDVNHTFILSGTAAAPTVQVISQPRREFSSDTALELWFVNLARNAGSVDIYVGEAGFDPAQTTPRASGLALDAVSPLSDIEAGNYEFVATVAGQPGSVLIRSEVGALLANDTVLVALYDAANVLNGDYLFVAGGELTGVRLADSTAPTRLQLMHTAFGRGNVDLYINDETVTPAIADIGFGSISPAVAIPEADNNQQITVTLTAAGNVGAQLATGTFSFVDAGSAIIVVTETPDTTNTDLQLQALTNRRQPLAGAARVSLFNAAQNVTPIDIYLLEAGLTPEDGFPRAQNLTPSLNVGELQLAGEIDIYVTDAADDSVIAGPVSETFSGGTVRQLVIVDTADSERADVLLLDPLAP